MSRRPRRPIQAPSTRWAITARSMPREVRRSGPSTQASRRRAANLSVHPHAPGSGCSSVPGIVERAGRWSDGAARSISLYARYLVATRYLKDII